MATTEAQWRAYWKYRQQGSDVESSAQKVGISKSTAYRAESKARTNGPQGKASESRRVDLLPAPKTRDDLCPEALTALDDFGYFQRRYFGRIALPWQEDAAGRVLEFLASPDKEFVVVNAPPGSGKTITFTHDIPAWLTVRNRSIRGLIGSSTQALANRCTARLLRTFQGTLPMQADDEDRVRGLALDAEATLADDYGRFQPLNRETWTKSTFVVVQVGNRSIIQKEATWTAYGMDTGFIGGRFDFVVWDDLVDPSALRTVEARENLAGLWDKVAERRLDPGGVLLLQGQRIGSDDLYRYCLDKEVPEDVDPDTGQFVTSHRMYHHVMYQAHDESRCQGDETHKRLAPSWHPDPEKSGCLLSNHHLPWRDLRPLMHNKREMFEVVFQQQDVDPASTLVHPDWIHGRNGFIGCVDEDRDRLELPRRGGQVSLEGDLFSVMTVDPSPTKYWALIWWIYQPAAERRWLMDLAREPLEAGEFLDWDPDRLCHTGLLEEWWQTSSDLGLPITHVVVERNAAQRFLLQYRQVQDWMSKRSVEVIAHDTHRNKSDPEYGVDTIGSHYKFGRVRLPYKRNSLGWTCSQKLIAELTSYPGGRTDDCVMAHWFLEWQLPHIYSPPIAGDQKQWRPSWSSTVPDVRAPRDMAVASRGAATMFERAAMERAV